MTGPVLLQQALLNTCVRQAPGREQRRKQTRNWEPHRCLWEADLRPGQDSEWICGWVPLSCELCRQPPPDCPQPHLEPGCWRAPCGQRTGSLFFLLVSQSTAGGLLYHKFTSTEKLQPQKHHFRLLFSYHFFPNQSVSYIRPTLLQIETQPITGRQTAFLQLL